jgi:hypothetical protein
MIGAKQMIDLIIAESQYRGHSLEALERGLIPFATIKQVGFIAGLLRKCGVPEEWRLYVVGQLVRRDIRSSKDLSMYEAGTIIDCLLLGSDGKGDSETEPCEEAKEAIGMLLMQTMAAGVAKMRRRKNGGSRVEVIQQLGFA